MDGWMERKADPFPGIYGCNVFIGLILTNNNPCTVIIRFYQTFLYFSAHICAVFKVDPNQDGAKLKDPEIDKELVYLIMDKVDQVFHNFAQVLGYIHKWRQATKGLGCEP